METKVCRDCGIEQFISEFGVCSTRKSGLMSACKSCNLIYNKSRRLAMGMKPRTVKPTKEALVALFDTMTVNEIAQHFNCSNTAVSKWLKSYKIQTIIKRYNWKPLDENILIDLYFNQMKSIEYIAGVFDCSADKVQRVFNKLNMKTRNLVESHTVTNSQWSGYEEIAGRYWLRTKKGAENRGLPFEITIEQAWELFINQKRKCALSGIELTMQTEYNTQSASLDRIDNSKGYTIDNLQWLHKHVNIMKRDHEQAYFVEICRNIAKHNA